MLTLIYHSRVSPQIQDTHFAVANDRATLMTTLTDVFIIHEEVTICHSLTFHRPHGQGGCGHHIAAVLHLVELGHQVGQFVGRQILFSLQIHSHFLSDMSAINEINQCRERGELLGKSFLLAAATKALISADRLVMNLWDVHRCR